MTEPSTPKTRPEIEILHLDEPGYGPNGSMTRKKWRELCFYKFDSGLDSFNNWQLELRHALLNGERPDGVGFGIVIPNVEIDFDRQWHPFTLDLSGIIFAEQVNAECLEFIFPCSFKYAVFDENVSFSDAKFSSDVDFTSAIFNKNVYISDAQFNGKAIFRRTKFKTDAWISNTRFKKSIDFNNAVFGRASNFENSVFLKVGHFEDADFKTEPPGFRGVEIATTHLEFSNAIFPKDSNTQQAIDDISFLKRLSDEHGQTDQALNFNAMELRAKRLLPDADWGFKVITWLYEVISDFGRSFTKPIIWYVVLICFGALLTMGYSTYSDRPAEELQVLCKPIKDHPPPLKLSYERAVFEYAIFRAGGVMDFTDTGKQNNAVNCRLFGEPIEPPLMRGWGVFKGVASIALLFLAALGLRNKYRIK